MQLNSRLAMLLAALQSVLAVASDLDARQESTAGRTTVIPRWDIQSTAKAIKDLAALSRPGADVSAWNHVDASRCTLMGCLVAAGVYNESQLFFSDNLNRTDRSPFAVPWLYRNEFSLSPVKGQHYFLENNGITSKADIYVNGQQIATKATQTGAYGGHTYEITKYATEKNAVLIQVYPTDYNYDFALGFVDWNPYPPDNGTGVWRDVFIKQTGPVSLGPLRVVTDMALPVGQGSATVTLKATVQNLEDHDVSVTAESLITDDKGGSPISKTQSFTLKSSQTLDLNISTVVDKPSVWWPKAWGSQPLYTGKLSVSVDSAVSDSAEKHFGIRKVSSKVNEHNDTIFSVNGNPFQVIGGGYSADIFLRWDSDKFTTQAQYMLDLGHNTVRLEGKNEHPELFEIADRMGLMILAGWECCDKWEAWTYNDDLAVKVEWSQSDYQTANASARHEIAMLQSHPSMLAFLVGSDYWPDDKATAIYVQAFKDLDWQAPIIASASKRSYPEVLGPSGMKMAGPYDWVPPNYWYDTSKDDDRLGAAFGFGSELGAGVGTPELASLEKFLSKQDMDDLWKQPNKGLYHMSTSVSEFYNRKLYNDALWKRHGAPTSLDDYLMKAQILDYEATRSQFEGFSSYWNEDHPATGLIYWMLNNAWPSLHWNLFDYYMRPAGSYFGAKVGARLEHAAYDYVKKAIYLINHSLDRQGDRSVTIETIGLDGKGISSVLVKAKTQPNTSKYMYKLPSLKYTTDVIFLRLTLQDDKGAVLSRNVYWLAKTVDTLDWENSDWWYTPVTKYADFKSIDKLQSANVSVSFSPQADANTYNVTVENHSDVPAFFVSLTLLDAAGQDVLPVFWSDNYVTLWPREKLQLEARTKGATPATVQLKGKNLVGPSAYQVHLGA